MVFRRFRRIGRGFAIALLLWTVVDLADHHVCDAATAPMPVSRAASVGTPGDSSGHRHSHTPNSCFGCSPCVDIQTPFALILADVSNDVPAEFDLSLATNPPRSLFHPPLAS
jgi:hypothetical protein